MSITTISYPWLPVLALLSIAYGVVESEHFASSLFMALGLSVIYFFTTRKVIEIASGGAVIQAVMAGADIKEARRFVEMLEDAKDARYMICSDL